jgi:hypothetical protein
MCDTWERARYAYGMRPEWIDGVGKEKQVAVGTSPTVNLQV